MNGEPDGQVAGNDADEPSGTETLIHVLTGAQVPATPKNRLVQQVLRQLIETYGFDRADIRAGYRPTMRGKRQQKVDIVILRHGEEALDEHVERVIVCQPQKPREKLRSPGEATADLRKLETKLELFPACHLGMWTNGHEEFFVRVAETTFETRYVDIGQQVLTPSERRKLGVVLEVSPHPGQVRGLDHFTVQIVSQETGPVGASRKVKIWKAARTHAAVSLLKLNRIDFEEGWHHVRVRPWTADGDPIPMDEPAEPTGKPANESEPFYVLPDAAVEEEPPQRAVPKAVSVEHARLDRQFAAVMQRRAAADIAPRSVGWTQRSTTTRPAAQATIEARFGTDGTFQIAVARWLKNIEQRILETPERPVSWRMQLHGGSRTCRPVTSRSGRSRPPCGGSSTPARRTSGASGRTPGTWCPRDSTS